jgi:hypothetical protein
MYEEIEGRLFGLVDFAGMDEIDRGVGQVGAVVVGLVRGGGSVSDFRGDGRELPQWLRKRGCGARLSLGASSLGGGSARISRRCAPLKKPPGWSPARRRDPHTKEPPQKAGTQDLYRRDVAVVEVEIIRPSCPSISAAGVEELRVPGLRSPA